MVREFTMRADEKMTGYFAQIVEEMQQRFSISRREAVARVNDAWGNLEFSPYPSLICHEFPEHWAYWIYYLDDINYWEENADHSHWKVRPLPPEDSPAWTLPRET